jgi:hypothetical protein
VIATLLILGLAAAATLDPSGIWDLNGSDLTGAEYQGSVLVQPWGPAYDVTWHTTIGDYQGIALVVEDRLYAAWGAGPGFGLVVYQIGKGRLDGQWVMFRVRGEPGVEWGTPRGRVRRGLIGTWELDGHAPGSVSQTYRSLLTVERKGRTYLLTWDTEGSVYQGIGFRHGDTLVVGWAYDTPGGLLEYKPHKGDLKGRWAIAGDRKRGHEDLRRRDSPTRSD